MRFWSKPGLQFEIARAEVERKSEERKAARADAERIDRLIALGEALIDLLDGAFAPKLKYHVAFWAEGAFGDMIVDLSVPLDTTAALVGVKAEIRNRLNFELDPVIIGWHGLKSE
jgi:hypothetical protein